MKYIIFVCLNTFALHFISQPLCAQVACDIDYCQLGENLVSNPSFEDYTSCPAFYSELGSCTGWTQGGFNGSSDYMNSCATPATNVDVPTNIFGSQLAATGAGYAGFYTYVDFGAGPGQNYREYARNELAAPMVVGQQYLIQMKVTLADNSHYATNQMGMYFSVAQPNVESPDDAITPQVVFTQYVDDTSNWVTMCALFTPTQAYQWILIGNFDNDFETTYTQISNNNIEGLNTAYYYIDDVSVAPEVSDSVIPPDLQASFTYQQVSSCPFPLVTFTNTSTDTTDNTTALWSFGDGTNSTNYQAGDYIYFAGGTYTVRLILTDENSCYSVADTVTTTINVQDCNPCQGVVPPTINADFTASTLSGCTPLAVSFNNTTPIANLSNPSYNWDMGNGQAYNTANPPNQNYIVGTYNIVLSVRDSTECYDVQSQHTATVTVDGCDPCEGVVPPTINANFTASTLSGCTPLAVSFANTTPLNNLSNPTYNWNLGNGQSANTLNPPNQTYNIGNYNISLTVRDSTLCYDLQASAQQSISVQLCDTTIVLFANAFSPNGNNHNDRFGIFASQPIDKYSLQIYNRWGERVFDTANPTDQWDGTYNGQAQPLGVYAWQCSYQIAGQTETKQHQGNVTLLR